MVNIGNVVESVKDPARFRTLTDIYPVTDGEQVRLGSGDGYCDLEVKVGERHAVMRCYLRKDLDTARRLGEVSAFLAAVDEPCYGKFSFHAGELLVFDENGGHCFVDVAVIDKYPGADIQKYIAGCLADPKNGIKKITALIGLMGEFARKHIDHRLDTGGRLANNFRIRENGEPVILGLVDAERGECPGDVMQIGVIGCILWLACLDPRVLDLLSGRANLTWRGVFSGCAGLGLPEPVGDFCATLASMGTTPAKPETEVVIEYLHRLSKEPVTERDKFKVFMDSVANSPVSYYTPVINISTAGYEYVGEMSCMMMRAFDGEQWCYLDKLGRVAIEGPYLDARDFWEGTAVVETPEGFGLIDCDGNYIILPQYDDMDLDETGNRLIVSKEGRTGMVSLKGEQIVGLDYDNIFPAVHGLHVVQSGDKFGFISRDGTPVTGIVYDEADCAGAENGFARGVRQGREYMIFPDGKEEPKI
ncbi:MAG: WG repeat-containing protein [Alistipes sp.]|nr:WG repeat-containing protein [Alistipes sp.]